MYPKCWVTRFTTRTATAICGTKSTLYTVVAVSANIQLTFVEVSKKSCAIHLKKKFHQLEAIYQSSMQRELLSTYREVRFNTPVYKDLNVRTRRCVYIVHANLVLPLLYKVCIMSDRDTTIGCLAQIKGSRWHPKTVA